ncbi:MAG: sigma-70 family RNA polymerase sigma factor [Deltaproteobacteria bacterium]
MATGTDEGDLAQRAGQGDKEAFRELVERYQRRVLAMVTGMLHDREAALEVTQEAFLKAYRSLDRFRGQASFYTWIYRIAVNLSIDYQRREWRKPIVDTHRIHSDGGVGEDAIDRASDDHPAADPFEATKDSELRARLGEAIGELTPDHRAVILLRELDGFSYEEISQVLQCSKGTVMSRLHYARKKLQSQLKEFE